jgi:aldose 1-epimerase
MVARVIVLEAGPARAEVVTDLGGRVGSLTVDGDELLVTGTDQTWMWGSFVMAPWVGRLAGGRFTHDGVTHQLAVNLPPHAIHGTVALRPWRVDTATATSAELTCELGDGWPLGGTTTQRLELAPDELRCWLRVTAADRSMPVAIGWHPWFRSGGPIDLEAEAMYERGPDHIPTGRLVAPKAPPWDDCFLTTAPAHVRVGDHDVSVLSDCDHLVAFDERPDHGVAIEPQSGPPDALNQRPVVLGPGESIERSMTIRWQRVLPTRG